MPFFEDTGNDFDFFYGDRKSSGNMAGMHIHPYYEAILIPNEVEQTAKINGHTAAPIYKPSLTVFSPFSMHQINFRSDEKYERLVWYFGDSMIKETPYAFVDFEKYSQNITTRFIIGPELLKKILPYLEAAKQMRGDRTFMKLNFLIVFHLVLCEGVKEMSLNPSEGLEKINLIIDYMIKHSNERLTAENICGEFYISRSMLNKYFKKYLSVGFHQLLNEMRLSRACWMLRHGQKDIKTIAYELGFEKETYFYTFFKKSTGMTPLQYRKGRTV